MAGSPSTPPPLYSVVFNSGIKERCEFLKNLAVAGIKIRLIELKSCEFRGKLTVAGIKVSGSKENAQFSSRNLHKLGPRAAKKLTVAGIKIRLIELESCELLQKLTVAGIKIRLIELKSCELLQKLALPELKSAELKTTL